MSAAPDLFPASLSIEKLFRKFRERTLRLLCVGAGLVLAACSTTGGPETAAGGAPVMRIKPVAYQDLAGWSDDTQGDILAAWRMSCARIEGKNDTDALDTLHGAFGHVGDWRRACTAAETLAADDHATVRRFLEAHFVPFAVAAGGNETGLFTGYYEPELTAAQGPSDGGATPIRARPSDLVEVDLGAFRSDLKGERVAGRVVNGQLVPYPARAEIQNGALHPHDDVLVWVDDPVDAFFLHIQGSGRVRLVDGTVMRLGYAGFNGHPYTAIGRLLVEAGELSRDNVSMQTIRAWLKANPKRGRELMEANKSYIFFKALDGEGGPLGAEGVPLTAGRSLAVDDAYYAYGVPVWVDTGEPQDGAAEKPLHRLMIAQDTGGAIRGPVRGDVFWGTGDAAGRIAGTMKQPGTLHLLLPRELAARQGWLDTRDWIALSRPGV